MFGMLYGSKGLYFIARTKVEVNALQERSVARLRIEEKFHMAVGNVEKSARSRYRADWLEHGGMLVRMVEEDSINHGSGNPKVAA